MVWKQQGRVAIPGAHARYGGKSIVRAALLPHYNTHPPQQRHAGGSTLPAPSAAPHCGRAQSARQNTTSVRVAIMCRCPLAGMDFGRKSGAAANACNAASSNRCARPGQQRPGASGEASYMAGLKSASSAARRTDHSPSVQAVGSPLAAGGWSMRRDVGGTGIAMAGTALTLGVRQAG